MVKWRNLGERDWVACEKCHAAIQADDREALLDRASLIPVPRTVPDRYAPQFLERARRLHVAFWETRAGRPSPPRSNLTRSSCRSVARDASAEVRVA
jgi:hypothetical protein